MRRHGSGFAPAARRERRRAVRREVQSLVYLKIAPDNGGVLHDLGEDGLRVSLANPLNADAECRFSILRQNHPPIEGVGRVAWLSKSGKAAGLRFVELPEESHEQIRRWLSFPTDDRETAGSRNSLDNTKAQLTERPPPVREATTPSSDRPEAMAGKVQTPLFFLPQAETKDLPGTNAAEADEAAQPAGNRSDDLEKMRFALNQKSEEQESKKQKLREILFAVRVTCVATLLLVGGILLIYRGNYAYQYIKSHALINLPFGHAQNVEPSSSKPAHARRPRRRLRPSRRKAARGSAATPAIWKAPKGHVPFQLEVTDSFNRRWVITASGQKMLPASPPHTGQEDASAATQPDTHGSAALDESAGIMEPSGNAAGPVEANVGNNVGNDEAAEPATIVTPKLEGEGDKVPFTVVLDAQIGPHGSVKNIHVVSSPSAALAWAVVEAVKKWHYPQFYREGHPTEVATRITVAFKGSPPKN